MRYYRKGIVLLVCWVSVFISYGQSSSIQVSINNYYYNCSTGQLNISYRIYNQDQFNSPNLLSNYGIKIEGVSKASGITSGSMYNGVFIGPYTPGDAVTIWAQGTNNNSSPYSSYVFTPAPAGTAPSSPPVVSVSGTTSLCSGQTTTLVASGSGTITWSNGMTGSSITVSDPGNYYATASGGCGISDPSNTVEITTGAVPSAPVVSNSGNDLLCNGASATLYANPSAGGNIYWNTGQTGSSISVSGAGTYYAYEINACGQSSNSNYVTITSGSTPAVPVIAPAGPIALCNGASVDLVVAGGGDITWVLNGTLFADNSGVLPVSAAGSYTALARNACGVSAQSVPVVVTTGSVPTVPTIGPAGSHLLCNGQTVTLTASGNSIVWSNGATGNTITVSAAGNYYAVDQNSCGNSQPSNVVQITTGNCPTPAPGNTFYICPGATRTLDAGTGYDTYLWSTGATTRTITVGAGNYAVSVTKEGCSAISSTVSVYNYTVNAALINASGPTTFCAGGSVNLIASNGSSWLWNTTATTQSITVSTSGTYQVTVTDANGCQATSAPVSVTVKPLPVATISGSVTLCRNAGAPNISFTANGGVPPFTFTYQINGGASQTVTTSGGNSVTVPVPTSVAGSFVYNLLGVQESSGCSNTASGTATVVVRELPTATITGSTTVCRDAAAPTITLSGNGGSAPYTFSYRINGGGVQTVTTSTGNSVLLSQPTNVAGTYVYELLNVQEATGYGCQSVATGTVTIVVKDLPTASISGSTTVCRNSSAPSVSFTGAGGSVPYTFQYTINDGAVQSVTTASGNSVSVAAPTSTAGTYSYKLVGVSGGCSNAANGEAIVTVRALPEATVGGNTTVCQNSSQPTVTFTGSVGVAPYTFTYRINNGALLTVSTSSGSSASVTVPTTNAGTFTYSLVSVKESGAGVCEQTVSGSVSILVNPQPVAAVIAAPNHHLCNGEAGIISVFNWVAGNTYTWYKDGILFTTTSAQTISVTQAGAYTVMVSTPEGCSAAGVSNTINITTGTVPIPVITGKLKVCPEGKTRLEAIGEPAFETWSWTVMPEGRTLGNSKSFSAPAGQYRVSVMREGCYDNATVVVTADDTEYPAGKLTISPNTIPYGGKATLVAEVSGAAGFEWDLGDNRKVVTLSNTMIQNYFVRDDSVHVRVRAISERNCITDLTGVLYVGPPGGTALIDRSWIGNLKDWNLFPNPFHDNLKMSVILKRNESVRIDLFTADGAWVKGWIKAGRKGENLFQLEGVETLEPNVVYIITAIYNGEKHADRLYRY